MNRTKFLFYIFFLFLFGAASSMATLKAQEVIASAAVDTNSLLIGDQTELKIELRVPLQTKVAWPTIQDTLSGKIEVVKKSAIDTLLAKDVAKYIQYVTITSFDSGFHILPPIIFGVKSLNDSTWQTTETPALPLQVFTVPVDTTLAIKDIKPIHVPPITFRDILPYIIILVGILLIVFVVIYIVRKRRQNLPILGGKPKPKLPPHIAALEALEELKHKKVWQSGNFKSYYTDLTTILRYYLEGRYEIAALEMVTDEIVEALKSYNINSQASEKLQHVLELSDLVKFAKMEPLPLENDSCLNYAFDFIQETKHVETVVDEKIENETSENSATVEKGDENVR